MRSPLSSVSSSHDGILYCIDRNGEIYQQVRVRGQVYKWKRFDTSGLGGRVPRQVHAPFDGRSLVVLTVDGHLYEYTLTGGSRDNPQGEWRAVSLDMADPL